MAVSSAERERDVIFRAPSCPEIPEI